MEQIHKAIKDHIDVPAHIREYQKSMDRNKYDMFLNWLTSLPVMSYNRQTGEIEENVLFNNVPDPSVYWTAPLIDLTIILF